jgi:hypothetical protein
VSHVERIALPAVVRRMLRMLEMSLFQGDVLTAGFEVDGTQQELSAVYCETPAGGHVVAVHRADGQQLGAALGVFMRGHMTRSEHMLEVARFLSDLGVETTSCSVEVGRAYGWIYVQRAARFIEPALKELA